MRLHRFYVSQPLGEEVVIDGVSLVHQWTKVFRYTAGDFVILFNGDGIDYSYSIVSLSQKQCTLALQSSSPVYIPTKKTYLYLAIIKKDNFEIAVQKATELGVTDVVPIVSARTEKKHVDTRRLQLIVQEATEQSGRGDILRVHEPIDFASITDTVQKNNGSPARTFVATTHGEPLSTVLQNVSPADNSPCAFVVGPEGGWTDAEEEYFKNENVTRVTFGKTILRAETAAIVSSFLSVII